MREAQGRLFAVANIVVFASLSLPVAAQEASSLQLVDLQSAAATVRDFKQKDVFTDSVPTKADLAGKHFEVEIVPIHAKETSIGCVGTPTWAYSSTDGFATFLIADSILAGDLSISYRDLGSLNLFVLTCKQAEDTYYRATNAFGGPATVRKTRESLLAFSDGEEGPRGSTWHSEVKGEAARSLSKSVRLRLSGQIGKWPDGSTVICGVAHRQATLDFPHEDTREACIFKTTSEYVEVIDSSDGRALFSEEWVVLDDFNSKEDRSAIEEGDIETSADATAPSSITIEGFQVTVGDRYKGVLAKWLGFPNEILHRVKPNGFGTTIRKWNRAGRVIAADEDAIISVQ
jgi:hypothetical protein